MIIPTKMIELSDELRAQRAEFLAGEGGAGILYFLDKEKGTRNGGRDPSAMDCATRWKDGNGKVWRTSDCVGFVMWANGAPRRLSTFGEYSGAINTDSMLLDAEHKHTHFTRLVIPHRGCTLTMPGKRKPDGRRSAGHTGIVVDVSPRFDPSHPDLALVKVAHCSPGNQRRTGQAVAITNALVFASREWRFLQFNP